MSDGPSKMAPPGAPPLDDIILGDDDATLAIPGRAAAPERAAPKDNDALAKAIEAGGIPEERGSQRPRDRSSNRVKAADPLKETRKRSKMTAAQKKAVSLRMKKYWADRRKAAAKA